LELAGQMIHLGGKAATPAAGRAFAEKLLASGAALEKFHAVCEWQGGQLAKGLPEATHSEHVRAEFDGHIAYTNLEKLGLASVALGAGRKFAGDALDFAAGIAVSRENGAPVRAGDTLFKLHFSESARAQAALPLLRESYPLTRTPVPRSPLIAKVLT